MAARAVGSRARARLVGSAARTHGPAPLALAVYTGLTLATLAVAWVRDTNPLTTLPLLELPASPAISLLGGLVLAYATVRATRMLVRRSPSVQALSRDLQPSVRDAGDGTLLVLGIASGVAEELFFRGLLVPVFGVVLPALAFGALHRLRGPSGRVWSVWAAVMGLLFGALFVVTGSLLGAIAAHVFINVLNLRLVRDLDPTPKPRPLGGLLRR
jgi:uncharacterized protein